MQLVAAAILNPPATAGRGGLESPRNPDYTADEQATLDKGREIYTQVCFACHGDDGRGTTSPGIGSLAPSLASSPRVLGHQEYVIKALLHGLTGPMNGVTYPDVMVPMGQNDDAWVAAIASYVRNAFGNRATLIAATDVARVRTATARRKQPWAVTELEASLPRVAIRDLTWKATASHNSATAPNGFASSHGLRASRSRRGCGIKSNCPRRCNCRRFSSNRAPSRPRTCCRCRARRRGRRAADAAARRARRHRAPAPAAPAGISARLPGPGLDGRDQLAADRAGQRHRHGDPRRLRARAREVREGHAEADTADLPPWTIQRLKLLQPGAAAGGTR